MAFMSITEEVPRQCLCYSLPAASWAKGPADPKGCERGFALQSPKNRKEM